MAVLGDRAVAGLLSALAEAPDFHAAASFLVAQLVDLSAAPRACLWRIDPSQEGISLVACSGFVPEPPTTTESAGDLSSPIVIASLAVVGVHGTSPLGRRMFGGMEDWYVLPLS